MPKKGVPFGIEKIAILLDIQGGRCAYCMAEIKSGKKRGGKLLATLDHVYPRMKPGGTHRIGNLLASCQPCNGLKGDRLPNEQELAILAMVAPEATRRWQIFTTEQYGITWPN